MKIITENLSNACPIAKSALPISFLSIYSFSQKYHCFII